MTGNLESYYLFLFYLFVFILQAGRGGDLLLFLLD